LNRRCGVDDGTGGNWTVKPLAKMWGRHAFCFSHVICVKGTFTEGIANCFRLVSLRRRIFPKRKSPNGPMRAELMLPNHQNGSYQIRVIVRPRAACEFLDKFSNMYERYNVGCFLIRLF
jgi:hypothetical protein